MSDNESEKKMIETPVEAVEAVETGSAEQTNELVVDLTLPTPLSKKEKRLAKKGKLDPSTKDATKSLKKDQDIKDKQAKIAQDIAEGKTPEAAKKSEFGVWIGNLSFDTSKEDIKRFVLAKSKALATEYAEKEDKSDGVFDSEPVEITDDDITRVNLPKKGKVGKGFAYMDFKTKLQMQTVINMSESFLNGRNILVKDANSYEGRPEVSKAEKAADKSLAKTKNPPSRILFVGNLTFDTTQEGLEDHFQHCGEIVKIRMATFEDTGKCKGFAFIDFREVAAAELAIADKRCKKMGLRPLRMEFGEDRSKRSKADKSNMYNRSGRNGDDNSNERSNQPVAKDWVQEVPAGGDAYAGATNTDRKPREEKRKFAPRRDDYSSSNKRQKPGMALANAQRAKTGIVASQGKKISFD
ncbi:hypothetical protein NADFUDRAFT_49378 [Nadsonia fulvescens var. elongata DSM 6958]|uniref:RRM domain-containing protein n=1 Tax=Nadsonia fulvescens var. elongata DSM 6958 TaxID=857566 RepID=A0A1E3PNP1_9ASCO|nr:hypothetical protein NADFUDRAFT_49378 [Nadsonia fulvescens var. elongata DSM 6958]